MCCQLEGNQTLTVFGCVLKALGEGHAAGAVEAVDEAVALLLAHDVRHVHLARARPHCRELHLEVCPEGTVAVPHRLVGGGRHVARHLRGK